LTIACTAAPEKASVTANIFWIKADSTAPVLTNSFWIKAKAPVLTYSCWNKASSTAPVTDLPIKAKSTAPVLREAPPFTETTSLPRIVKDSKATVIMASLPSKPKVGGFAKGASAPSKGGKRGRDNEEGGSSSKRPQLDKSVLFPINDQEGSLRFKYDFFSQNPAVEIRAGITTTEGFAHEQSIHFNSECMEAIHQRANLKQVTGSSLWEALSFLAKPTCSDDEWESIVASTKNSYQDNGIDLVMFKIIPSAAIRIINQKGTSTDLAVISKIRVALADDVQYITILRGAIEEKKRFVDRYWDRLVAKSLQKGIYWGYDLDRPGIMDFETKKEVSYPIAVLKGPADMPALSWMREEKDREVKLLSHPFKQWFTSTDELQRRLTVALLQDHEASREKLSRVYSYNSSAPQHSITINRDPQDPRRYLLSVKANKPIGMQLPEVAADTKFKLRNEEGEELEAVLLAPVDGQDLKGHDFVLAVEFSDSNNTLQGVIEGGVLHNVMLNADNNITAAERQLNALPEFVNKASKQLKELLLGFPVSLESNVPDVYEIARADLRKSNKPKFNSYNKWRQDLTVNRLQDKASKSCLESHSKASMVQGAPGSGKSNVAVNCALDVAQLGFRVLIASPTRTAGKANAKKLTKEWHKLPAGMKMTVMPVYFPTWSESIQRMYEAKGFKEKRTTLPEDAEFDDMQIWRLVVAYSRELLKKQGVKPDERAETFLKVFNMLSKDAVLTSGEINAFSKHFKTLATEILTSPKFVTIVISTCNNSACIAAMKVKTSLLLIDESAVAVDRDIIVPLQIEHDKVMFLGDHLQLKPVVTCEGSSEYYSQECVSFFERILEYTPQERTLLNISYRFGQEIADPIGMFGGYEALAANPRGDSEWYESFSNAFNTSTYSMKLRPAPEGALYHKEDYNVHYHRLALCVKDGFSSTPRAGSSTINHANINAGIAFLQEIVRQSNGDIRTKDLMVITPFSAQAELWREQIKIQWPGSEATVSTVGSCQGNEAKLALFDFTIAWQSEGAFLGFLREWNRCNVALSRGCDVVVSMLNEKLMRGRIQSLYKQNRSWALYLLDLIDCGLICDVNGSQTLPSNAIEFLTGTKAYTNEQPQSATKSLSQDYYAPTQSVNFFHVMGAQDTFTTLELGYLDELRALRGQHQLLVKKILDEENNWQASRKAAGSEQQEIVMLGLEVAPLERTDDVTMEEVEALAHPPLYDDTDYNEEL
ncbi:hypothetical protein IFR04_012056, partial [Cadophora malorum]